MRNLFQLTFFLFVFQAFGQVCVDVHASDSNGNSDITVDCDYVVNDNVCIDLQVDYTEIPSTEDYEVNEISFEPIIPFDQGIPLTPQLPLENGIVDDKFSEAIPLGFKFCFYDQNFSEIVIGTNGILTFDLDEANGDTPASIPVTNPDPALIDNAIFGVQQDLVFDTNTISEIYYTTIGTAPCRQFVVNYYEALNFGCPDLRTTVQVVLYETTNEIEVHMLNKPEHCNNGRDANSLLGIMNGDGTQGISPPGRNTSDWGATEESWRFEPTGTRPPLVVWFNDLGEEVGRGDQVNVCPNRNTTYSVEVQYQSCVDNVVFGNDTIEVTFDALFPVIENNIVLLCDTGNDGSESITFSDYNEWIAYNDADSFNFSYYATLEDATVQNAPITQQTVDGNRTFYVRIENSNNPNCFTITAISFSFSATAISTNEIFFCDNNNDDIEEDINIESFIDDEILSGINYNSYSVHISEEDAEDQINAVSEIDIEEDSQFWINLITTEGCEQIIGPIDVSFNAAPGNRSTSTLFFEKCDINYDHAEIYDWDYEIPRVMNIAANETFTVHTSIEAAEAGTSSETLISDIVNPYYIRIENELGCYTIIEQPVDVQFYGVDAVSARVNICFDGTEDVTIDLNDYIVRMLRPPTDGVEISFFSNSTSATNNISSDIIPAIQTITTDGYLVQQTFYVRFQLSDDCYTVKPLTIKLIHPVPMVNLIDVCDIYNDNSEDNALAIYDSYILGDQSGTVHYYLDEEDAINEQNELLNFNFTENQTLWVKITSFGCSENYPINFQLQTVPPTQNIDVDLGQVCDTDQDGLTELNLSILSSEVYTSNSNNVTFNYYLDYDPATETLTNPISNPEEFAVAGDFVFYLEVREENNNCPAIAIVNVDIEFTDTFEINNSELYICDADSDFNEEFYLNDALPQITANLDDYNPDLYEITYHTNEEDAISGQNPIVGDTYTPNSGTYFIYVRFYNLITSCVATNILTLYTLGEPKPVNGQTYVCDTNLDGAYELDLSTLNQEIMDETSGFIFTYYLSEEDAVIGQNALPSDVLYETSPFPSAIWVRVERESLEACYDVKSVTVNYTSTTNVPTQDFSTYGCDLDNNGNATFDLTFVEQNLPLSQYSLSYFESLEQVNNRASAISNPASYNNATPYQSSVVAVVEEQGYCPNYIIINLEYVTIDVQVENALSCTGDSVGLYPEILDPSGNYSFEWFDAQGNIVSTDQDLENINEAQLFNLIVTNLDNPNCQISLEVEAMTYESPIIMDIEQDGNTINVVATGAYPIEYSLNGVDWQPTSVFTDLEPGSYTFWVRYIEQGCISEPRVGIILNIPNIITPNGDGYNDYVEIENLNIFGEAESTLTIFDRYGKVIFEETSNTTIKWDGTFEGRVLNSTDYWYKLTLPDGQEYTGSITVKNY